jgi:hypothetical protein
MLRSTSCSYCSPEGFVVDVNVDAVAYVDLGVDVDNDVNADLGVGFGNGFLSMCKETME